MSNLLPKSAVVILDSGEAISVRPWNAKEISQSYAFLKGQVEAAGESFDPLSVLMRAVNENPQEVFQLIAASAGKSTEWASALYLPDLLALVVEIITVNAAHQKKTADLLVRLMSRLAPLN